MARPTKTQATPKTTNAPGGAPGVPLVNEETLYTKPALAEMEGQITSSAFDPDVDPGEVKIRKFRVGQDKRINWRGSMTLLRAGKVVDELNYNIQALRGQGVVLTEITDETAEFQNAPAVG